MKYCLLLLLTVGLLGVFNLRCGIMEGAGADHPLPVTPSIMPLSYGNWWRFHYTLFDSTGKSVDLPDRDLVLKIAGVFTLSESDSLVDVTDRYEWIDDYGAYVYKYEWEGLDSGYLVQHEGGGPFAERGLYIMGEFSHGKSTLFDTPRLWYQYPAYSESQWTVDLPGGDTVLSTFKCLSLNHTDYALNSGGKSASPALFMDSCILFREVADQDTYYHSFKPEVGKISLQHYRNGIIREAYILTDYHLNAGKVLKLE